MLFTDELRNHVGELVQVVTAVEIIAGVLLSVTDGAVIVRTSPSYNHRRCSCAYSYYCLCSLGRVRVIQV